MCRQGSHWCPTVPLTNLNSQSLKGVHDNDNQVSECTPWVSECKSSHSPSKYVLLAAITVSELRGGSVEPGI